MEEQSQARVWPVLVTLLVALTLMLLSGAALGLFALVVSIARGEKPDVQALLSVPWVMLLTIAASQAMVLLTTRVVPVIAGDVGNEGWAARVRWAPSRFSPASALLAWVGCMSAGQVASFLVSPLQRDADALMRFDQVARSASPVIFVLLLVAGGLAPGLAEELLFRGLAQSRFVQRFGPLKGIALASFLFGAYHLDLRQGLAAMVMGVWLGWFSWRDGSVVNNALGHALNNISAFLLSRFVGPALEFDRSPAAAGVAFVVLVLCCALTARFVRAPREEVRSTA